MLRKNKVQVIYQLKGIGIAFIWEKVSHEIQFYREEPYNTSIIGCSENH